MYTSCLRPFLGAIGLTVALVVAAPAVGYTVPMPSGNFTLTVQQGGSTLIQHTAPLVIGSDIYLGQITRGSATSDVYLEVAVRGYDEFRIVHWFIKSKDLNNPNEAGAASLFDPANGLIDVSISGVTFGGTYVTPQVGGSDPYEYDVSYFTDKGGNFYETPGSKNVNPAFAWDVQVPATLYNDATASPYQLTTTAGVNPTWEWNNIIPPSLNDQVWTQPYDALNQPLPPYKMTSYDPGYVRELGLSIAFTAMPEPAAMVLLAAGLPLLRRRRGA